MSRFDPLRRPVLLVALVAVAALAAFSFASCGSPTPTNAPRLGGPAATTTPGDPGAPPGATGAPAAPAGPTQPAGQPATDAPGHDEGDDSVATDPDAYQSSTITTGPADPRVAATDFLVRYLNHGGRSTADWRNRWQPLATPGFIERAGDVDPAGLPPGTIGGAGDPIAIGDHLVNVPVVLRDGRAAVGPDNSVITSDVVVTVTLTGVTGRWLADALDLDANDGAP